MCCALFHLLAVLILRCFFQALFREISYHLTQSAQLYMSVSRGANWNKELMLCYLANSKIRSEVFYIIISCTEMHFLVNNVIKIQVSLGSFWSCWKVLGSLSKLFRGWLGILQRSSRNLQKFLGEMFYHSPGFLVAERFRQCFCLNQSELGC